MNEDELTIFLQETWCDLLEIEHVTADQDFFDIGGDSMLAIRMLAAVLTAVETEIDFERFFDEPTIRNLTGLLQEQREQTVDRSAV
jgi:acyl carrier protein